MTSALASRYGGVRYLSLTLRNFLSYQEASLEFGDLIALVGPNASGKSNAVAAIKLLREIPFHGLATAIAKRGGFDQLRHRSAGHPYDPALQLTFRLGSEGTPPSTYELQLRALKGKRYEVKLERASIFIGDDFYSFENSDGVLTFRERIDGDEFESRSLEREFKVPPGQSAITTTGGSFAAYVVGEVLQGMQTIEINPTRVGELQEPSSTREFESDGSNTASIFETLSPSNRAELVDELSAIVPGITRIEMRRFADRLTLAFGQQTPRGAREFLAKQMSDGTLRAFSILLSMHQLDRPALIVVEEPEIAIHLGALRTLVDILQQQSEESQLLITTHSADIIDTLPVESLRVVWSDGSSSRVAPAAPHTIATVRDGLITPGELLRSDALDPAV